ncbi:MAG: cytochrome c biogenesis CcdA family protein [Candidatus Sifarchaeia archaeon]|jgi:cytochrome c-type biogenesis protein
MVPLIPLNLIIAFAAGLLTFFAGCLAPIAPVYVGYLAGSSPEGLDAKHKATFTKNALIFTAGFLSIFLLLGLTVNTFARSLAVYRPILDKFIGILLIVIGLQFAKLISIPFLNKTYQAKFKGVSGTSTGAFLLGTTFGFAWTPCVGPVLAAILFWAGSQSTFAEAIPLLLLFSLGLGTPFVLLGLAFDKFLPLIKKFNTYAPTINKISGILLVIFGILIFTGNFSVISSFLLQKLGSSAGILELKQ